MSSRPREAKKLSRLRKAMRDTPPTSINLVQYLKDRRYARTSGAARQVLLDGKVSVDGEATGRVNISSDPEKPNYRVWPLVPAVLRDKIEVAA